MALQFSWVLTKEGDANFHFFDGPLLTSIIISLEDEDKVIKLMREGFDAAREEQRRIKSEVRDQLEKVRHDLRSTIDKDSEHATD